MFYTDEDKKQVLQKWEHILCAKCTICNGDKYKDGKMCKCKIKALKHTALEVSNMPVKGFQINKEHIQQIDFNFKDYFNNIQNEIYNIHNLYLQGFSNELLTEVIGYISKNLINTKHNISNENITVYYDIFENLIQLGLRSSSEKDARNKLNKIMQQPHILFLDGIGIESGLNATGKFNIRLLNLILKERLNRCKSTIICSDLTLSNIETIYGEDTVKFIQNYKQIKG